MGNCRERDSLASWNRNDPSTGVWEREKGERERKKERGKVIKKIMDGSLLQLQRTNSHFQFAPGGRGSKPTLAPTLGRILARSWIGPAIFSKLPKNSISRPTSVPPPTLPFDNSRLPFEKPISPRVLWPRIYTRNIPDIVLVKRIPSSSASSRDGERERERRGVFIDRNIVPRRFRAAMVGRKEHSELIPSNDALA